MQSLTSIFSDTQIEHLKSFLNEFFSKRYQYTVLKLKHLDLVELGLWKVKFSIECFTEVCWQTYVFEFNTQEFNTLSSKPMNLFDWTNIRLRNGLFVMKLKPAGECVLETI